MKVPAQQIIVRVGPDGTVQADTVDILGPKCLDTVTLLEDLLEAASITSSFTDDYYRTKSRNDIEDSNDLYH